MNINNIAKLNVIFITIVGLIVSVIIGQRLGSGQEKNVLLFLGGISGVAIFLYLGKKYWWILIFGFVSGIPIYISDGKIIELTEIASLSCFGIFIAMLVFGRNTIKILNIETIVVLLFILWIAFIYSQNPVGFAFFGSQDIGIRDYIKIIFGLLAFLVISNQVIEERDCKWIIRMMIIGSILALGWEIFQYKVLGTGDVKAIDAEYTWHQALSFPARTIMLYVFCRYGIKRIFSLQRLDLLFLSLACFVVALISGKRAGTGVVIMTPFAVALLHKQKTQAIIYLIIGTLGVSLLVFGHGVFFNLPSNVQRSFANLPGNWDSDIKAMTEYGGDGFRFDMREMAWEKLSKNPIVGKGIGLTASDIANMTPENYMSSLNNSLAIGSSWHNTWLGLWADFGLPAVILHAVICILCLKFGWVAFRGSRTNVRYLTSFNILAMMMFLNIVFDLARSYTSGSSTVPYSLWWQFGLVVAMARSLETYHANEVRLMKSKLISSS